MVDKITLILTAAHKHEDHGVCVGAKWIDENVARRRSIDVAALFRQMAWLDEHRASSDCALHQQDVLRGRSTSRDALPDTGPVCNEQLSLGNAVLVSLSGGCDAL